MEFGSLNAYEWCSSFSISGWMLIGDNLLKGRRLLFSQKLLLKLCTETTIELINQAAKDACWLSRVTRQNRRMQSCKWILATDLLFVPAVYYILFLLPYIQKVEYWFYSSFSLLLMVLYISYSNKEAGFLSEDCHLLTLTQMCWNYCTTQSTPNGQWTRPFFSCLWHALRKRVWQCKTNYSYIRCLLPHTVDIPGIIIWTIIITCNTSYILDVLGIIVLRIISSCNASYVLPRVYNELLISSTI